MQPAHDRDSQNTYTLYDLYEGKVTRATFFTGVVRSLNVAKSPDEWHAIMRTYLQELFLFLSDLSKKDKTLVGSNAIKNYGTQTPLLRDWVRLSSFVKHQTATYVSVIYAETRQYIEEKRKQNDALAPNSKSEVELLKETKNQTPLFGLSCVVERTFIYLQYLCLQGDSTQKAVKQYFFEILLETWKFSMNDYFEGNSLVSGCIFDGLSLQNQYIAFQDIQNMPLMIYTYCAFSESFLRQEILNMMKSVESAHAPTMGTGKCPLPLNQQRVFKGYVKAGLKISCNVENCKDIACSKILRQSAISFIVKYSFALDASDDELLVFYFSIWRQPKEGELNYYTVVRYFINRKVYSPMCADILFSARKRDAHDKTPIFTEADINTDRFRHAMTFLVGRYYQCENEETLALATPTLAHNIKEYSKILSLKAIKDKAAALTCVSEYLMEHVKRIEIAREKGEKEIFFQELTTHQRSTIIIYLASYFFITALQCSKDEDSQIILEPLKVQTQLHNQLTSVHSQLQQGQDAYLATVCVIIYHMNFTDAHFYHFSIPEYLHSNMDGKSLKNLLICYERYYVVMQRDIKIELDYDEMHESLYKGIYNTRIGVGSSNIKISYYSMIDGVKVSHAGIDAKGLLRHCIQDNVDRLLKKSYVKRDEDNKIYFDWGEILSVPLDQRQYNFPKESCYLTSLIILIIATGEPVDLPFKEEILRQFFQEVPGRILSSSSKECLRKSITLLKEGKIDQKEYDENVDMIESQYRDTYGKNCMRFVTLVRRSIKHVLTQDRHRLYFQTLRELFFHEFTMSPKEVAAKIQLSGKDVALTRKEAASKVRILKKIVKGMTQQQVKKLVTLAFGKLDNITLINVYVRGINMLPQWNSCSSRMEIGLDICEERLAYAMDNVQGFHLI